MYARSETAAAEARYWSAIRAAAGDRGLPETLGSPDDLMAHWRDPDLAFSQTCGLPYRTSLYGTVRLIGTPDHGLPGCLPGHYNSVLVMRRAAATEDPAAWVGLRLARNSRGSQSGWAAAQSHVAPLGLAFDALAAIDTGSHRGSVRAVAEGAADIACIDARSWAMIREWDAEARALREVARTAPTPGLPYITGPAGDPAALAAAVRGALEALEPDDRACLGITGLVEIPAEAYLAVPTPDLAPDPALDPAPGAAPGPGHVREGAPAHRD